MAHLSIDDRAFQSAFTGALKDEDADSETILHQVGEAVVSKARSLAPRLRQPDPRYRPGDLAASINMRSGRDKRGPWVEVGTDKDYAIFAEYGTFKDKPTPFMRPALALAARSSGGRIRGASSRARAFTKRTAKRNLIRRALQRGQITGTEARTLSRQVSSSFRVRARRRR